MTVSVPVVHINRLLRVSAAKMHKGMLFSTNVPIMEQTVGQGDQTRISNDNKYLRSYNITAAYDTSTNGPLVVQNAKNPQVTFSINLADKNMSPLHYTLIALAGCEIATAEFLAKSMGLHLGRIKFNKIEGLIDYRGYVKGDSTVPLHWQIVNMDAEFETNATEEQFNILRERVEKQCPVFGLFKASGCKMNINWKIGNFKQM